VVHVAVVRSTHFTGGASEHQRWPTDPADPAATEHGRQAARSVVFRVGVGDVRAGVERAAGALMSGCSLAVSNRHRPGDPAAPREGGVMANKKDTAGSVMAASWLRVDSRPGTSGRMV
jgi:hypothetical protein